MRKTFLLQGNSANQLHHRGASREFTSASYFYGKMKLQFDSSHTQICVFLIHEQTLLYFIRSTGFASKLPQSQIRVFQKPDALRKTKRHREILVCCQRMGKWNLKHFLTAWTSLSSTAFIFYSFFPFLKSVFVGKHLNKAFWRTIFYTLAERQTRAL